MPFASPYVIAFMLSPFAGLVIARLATSWSAEAVTAQSPVSSPASSPVSSPSWRDRAAGAALCLGVACSAFLAGPDDAWLRVIAGLSLGWALAALALIDLRSMILPDVITLPLVAAGLAFWALMEPSRLPAAALGAGGGYLALWGLAALYQRLRGEAGMGLGDAKLLAAGGAFLGWQALPAVLAGAGWLGLFWVLFRRWRGGGPGREDRIPFGPFLALSIWAGWLALI